MEREKGFESRIAPGFSGTYAPPRTLQALERWLGPRTGRARVAVEACREAWWVVRQLKAWGQEPVVVDTTRARQLGIGHHRRKTDRVDAEVLARSLENGLIPEAHVLSEPRQDCGCTSAFGAR